MISQMYGSVVVSGAGVSTIASGVKVAAGGREGGRRTVLLSWGF